MQEAQAYFLSMGPDNVNRTDRSLVVNCTGLCVLPQPFSNRTEAGREDYYLQYLVKGEMAVWLDGGKRLMKPGQAILYYPHTRYHYAMHGPGEVQYYWVHFTGSEAAALAEECRLPNRTLMDVGNSSNIRLDFEGLFQDFIVRDSCFSLSTAAKLTAICVELSRRVERAGSSPSETDSRIYHALSYIHKNYGSSLTIEQLAGQEHLSISRFRTLFKLRTGLSPMDYLIVLRMNRARQLMAQTDLAVGEIAVAVGYQDQMYFSRLFKKKVGLTPSEYRQAVELGRE